MHLSFLSLSLVRFRMLARGAALVALIALVAISGATLGLSSAEARTTARALASAQERFVVAKNGRAVRYQLIPGKVGRPVYVTFNGLIYNQGYWNPFLSELNKTGATIIRYSFSADPESLLVSLKAGKPVGRAFSVEGLADEVEAVLNEAKVDRAVLLTLSFGSIGIEFALQHPERVERVVLMSPMVQPNDVYDTAGAATRVYLENVRALWGEAAYEIQWGLMMEPTVRALVYKRVASLPDYVPAGLTVSAVSEGAMEKIKATRHFDLREYATKRLPRIDLMLAEDEDSGLADDQQVFWKKLSKASKGNYAYVRGADHALPATAPAAALKALAIFEAMDGTQKRPYQSLELNTDGSISSYEPTVSGN